MIREKTAWCIQRGVAHINITVALFDQPGTTLMRPACNARMPARTTGAGCIINSFSADVTFCCAALRRTGVRHARTKRRHRHAIAFELAMKALPSRSTYALAAA
jgi:hypothetical protein